MINVEGKSEEEAKNELSSKGLVVNVVYENNNSKPEGTVLKQSITNGTTVNKGDTVTITICSGKTTISVSNVVGKTKNEAQNILTKQGFKVTVSEIYSEDVENGRVISQSPESGSSLIHGSIVTINVSKGKEPIGVEDVTGQSKTNAQNILTRQGFKVSVKEEYSETVANGRVISQSPAKGETLYKGDTVTITVSKGKSPVNVSNVVGKTQTDAENILKNQGFTVKVKESYSDTVAKGKVISQSPVSNASAYKGDIVTITVSKGKATIIVTGVTLTKTEATIT